jgi:type I restriction enzyme S subunit
MLGFVWRQPTVVVAVSPGTRGKWKRCDFAMRRPDRSLPQSQQTRALNSSLDRGDPPKLQSFCELIVDCEHKTAPLSDVGIPSIRTPNIGRGRLMLDGVNLVSEAVYREWTRRAEPRAGDLILAREAPVGNVALVPAGLRVCLGQRTVLICPRVAVIDASFLCYFLLAPPTQEYFASVASGATVPHLNVADIRNAPLPSLPPLPIQRRIAAVLGAYDDLIENNARRIRVLEEMARTLYREWIEERRAESAQDPWPVATVRSVIELNPRDVFDRSIDRPLRHDVWPHERLDAHHRGRTTTDT